MEAEKKPPAVSDVGAWAMNVVSSVGIIMANKQLMSSSGYAFAFGTPLRACSIPLLPIWNPDPPALGESADLMGRVWLLLLLFFYSACECAQPPR